MSQIVTTPDGVEHEFPDSTPDDVIKKALSSYSKPSAPSTPQGYQSPSWLPGAGWLHKMSNIFDDSATLGGADAATGTVGNLLRGAGIANATPDVATLRAQTGQNRTDVGPLASAAADIAGYAVGPGAVGVGEKLAGLAGGKLWARMGGSAAEGALASGGGTLGHGGSLSEAGQAAKVGGLIGAVTGALPGGRGPRPDTPPSADLQDVASQAYAPLKDKVYPPAYPASAMTKASLDVNKGLESKMSSNMGDKIAQINRIISSGGNVTADNIASFQSALRGAARNPADEMIAEKYAAAFNRGVGSKTATDIAAANRASNIAQTGGEIEGWAANPSKAPAAIKSALETSPYLYKTQPGLFDALNKIGQKANEPSFTRQVINHLATGAAGAALGGVGDYIVGDHTPLGLLSGAITGATLPRIKSVVRTGPVKADLLAAQHLNATGVPVDTGVFTNPWLQRAGELMRQGGYAAGATGGVIGTE